MSHNFYLNDAFPLDQEPVLVFLTRYPNTGLRCHFDLATTAFHITSNGVIIPYRDITYWLPDYNPLTLPGLQLYLTEHTATVNSWLDLSPNAFDFVQNVPAKQPTISTNSVDFDGISQFQKVATAQPLNDATGIMFFSGVYDNTNFNRLFNSGDEASGDNYMSFQALNTTNKFRFVINYAGALNQISSTDSIVNGDYFHGYMQSIGASYVMSLNEVNQALVIGAGANNGKWGAHAIGRDNMSIGALIRSTFAYGPTKLNKLIYSNAALTADEILHTDQFMSKPTNF